METLLDELRDVQLIDNTPDEAKRAWTEIEAALSRRGAIEKGHIAALRAVMQEHTALVEAVQPLLEYLDLIEERYSRAGMSGPLPDAAYVPGDICRHVCLGTLRRIAATAGQIPSEETNTAVGSCKGCGNEGSIALFGNEPGSGNDLCRACEGYSDEAWEAKLAAWRKELGR